MISNQEYQDLRQKIFGSHQSCEHKRFERRQLITKSGTRQVKHQCLDCGVVSQNKKHMPGDHLIPMVDDTISQSLYAKLTEEYNQAVAELIEHRKAEMSRDYGEYLNSPQWRAIRQKVLKRDNHICQGCLVARATCVHHNTYDNVRDELCFQLISLCDDCHKKIHPDKEN